MTKTLQTVTSSKTKFVFLGTGPVAAASLDFLARHFTVEAVITKARSPGHKGSMPVEELAEDQNIPVFLVTNKANLENITDQQSFASNVGIVVDFGIIISQKVIDSFERGIVNSHFSLLPEWRGADPISYSVLSGQSKTGVSLMVIDAGLDTGKLITSRSMPVDPKDTTGSLTKKLVNFSNELLLEFLPRYLNNEITPKNQPHPDRATYSHKLSKADAVINWHEDATEIERKIRAYQPWPKARTTLGGIECILINADVAPSAQKKPAGTVTLGSPKNGTPHLSVECGHDALSINILQPLGKKEMPVEAFLAGYKHKFTQ
jgi:methionyl-tRNA formyltransferase